jgi:hypothetical protein
MSESFEQWLVREIPPGTVISNPLWWAPKIRQALQSGEPVAWHISKDPDGDQSSHVTADGEFASSYAQMGWKVSPLYTNPQPVVPECLEQFRDFVVDRQFWQIAKINN